jgi:hypothetical protein
MIQLLAHDMQNIKICLIVWVGKVCKRLATDNDETRLLLFKAKLIFKNHPIKCKYGIQVPTSHHDIMMIDAQAGNKLWQEEEAKEIKTLMNYKKFKDLGKGGIPPPGFKKSDVTWFMMSNTRTDVIKVD